MNELQIFEHEEFGNIRAVEIDGEPWFVGKDVALSLGYSNTTDALVRHVDLEDKQIIQRSENTTFNIPNRGMTIINESGLYSLILSSKLPGAKRFKRWVTSEVLPALRKTGDYSLCQVTEQRGLTIDDYIKAASIVSNCRNERLPYVLGFLEQGGLTLPEIQKVSGRNSAPEGSKYTRFAKTDEDLMAQCTACDMLRAAITNHGFIQADICRMTGINKNALARYRTGKTKPSAARARYIIEVLTRNIPQEEESGP